MSLERYDCGLIGGNEGWTVQQWQDAIRSYLDDAHDFYEERFDELSTEHEEKTTMLKMLSDRAETTVDSIRGMLKDIDADCTELERICEKV